MPIVGILCSQYSRIPEEFGKSRIPGQPPCGVNDHPPVQGRSPFQCRISPLCPSSVRTSAPPQLSLARSSPSQLRQSPHITKSLFIIIIVVIIIGNHEKSNNYVGRHPPDTTQTSPRHPTDAPQTSPKTSSSSLSSLS